MKIFASAAFTMLLAASTSSAALGDRPCPPDINCSGQVDIDDLLSVIGAWGGSGGASDVNGSGTVDIDDLLAVIGAWGECRFDFGPQYANAEAHQIGLEMLGANGALTLSQSQYNRLDRDLGLIRAEFPDLASQTHSMAWAPNAAIIAVFHSQPAIDLPCLNVFYQVVNTSLLFSSGGVDYYVYTFAGKVNIPALCAIYSELPEVSFGEPDGLIGGQNFWEPVDMGNGTWRWNIDDGFHDCFDGCDCHRYYVIDVDAAGAVTLISYQEVGASWCKF